MTLALMMAPKICPELGLKTMELVKWSQRRIHGKCRIGTREVVGFGCNGTAAYKDDAHFPFPSIRFQENNTNIAVSTVINHFRRFLNNIRDIFLSAALSDLIYFNSFHFIGSTNSNTLQVVLTQL